MRVSEGPPWTQAEVREARVWGALESSSLRLGHGVCKAGNTRAPVRGPGKQRCDPLRPVHEKAHGGGEGSREG